ncbi:hypothetical protein BJF79_42930 [Actinomadura sp. CNU-125]|uniref:hypothetical protein n=1 Tax=Actinomadura sp. CNU-125 TaxID=1904961 RepID=UPI000969F784|nr:hypothetical protein [Actinomadura sp. CNU-125]OLT27026.1 hypothetical protein BJF79_42930 [Actinomadura sp. CNU-125]
MNEVSSQSVTATPEDACLFYLLGDLIEVTAKLDERRLDRRRIVEELITVSCRVAAAAEPVLDGEAALITALRDAEASRPARPVSCPGCEQTDEGLCGRHAGSDTVAKTFNDLGNLLSGPSYRTRRPQTPAVTAPWVSPSLESVSPEAPAGRRR